MASFCLQLAIPELWIHHGTRTPRSFPLTHQKVVTLRSRLIAGSAGAGSGGTPTTSPASTKPSAADVSPLTTDAEQHREEGSLGATALSVVASWQQREQVGTEPRRTGVHQVTISDRLAAAAAAAARERDDPVKEDELRRKQVGFCWAE